MKIRRFLAAAVLFASATFIVSGIIKGRDTQTTSTSVIKATGNEAETARKAAVRKSIGKQYRKMADALTRKDVAAYFNLHTADYQEKVLWGGYQGEVSGPPSGIVSRTELVDWTRSQLADTLSVSQVDFVIKRLIVNQEQAVALVEKRSVGRYVEREAATYDHPSTWDGRGRTYRQTYRQLFRHRWQWKDDVWKLEYGEQVSYPHTVTHFESESQSG